MRGGSSCALQPLLDGVHIFGARMPVYLLKLRAHRPHALPFRSSNNLKNIGVKGLEFLMTTLLQIPSIKSVLVSMRNGLELGGWEGPAHEMRKREVHGESDQD